MTGKKGSSKSKLCLGNRFAFCHKKAWSQRDNDDERVP